jgi:hypothetical protein
MRDDWVRARVKHGVTTDPPNIDVGKANVGSAGSVVDEEGSDHHAPSSTG